MADVVERMARAICIGKGGRPDDTWFDEGSRTVRREWERFEKDARSAALALRPCDARRPDVTHTAEQIDAVALTIVDADRGFYGDPGVGSLDNIDPVEAARARFVARAAILALNLPGEQG